MEDNIVVHFFEKYPKFSELILSNLNIDFHYENEKIIINDNNYSKKLFKIINILLDTEKERGYLERSEVIDTVSKNIEEKIESQVKYQLPKMLVKARTKGQSIYLNELNNSDIVIAIGPAGTGKTFLAVARAVHLLINRKIKKIVLIRPAVEAGENLGFLPGDMKEKVDPYLKPLYDSLYMLLDRRTVEKYIDEEIIEIAPLAYMRGRTLADSCIILDEAQNTTSMQMKMFLTRLGINSKAIITGDITQIDLKEHFVSGLVELEKIVSNIKAIKIIKLNSKDVIRHPLVKDIINAYAEFSER